MNTPPALRLEQRPADCWDWIKPDDVMRHALAAFYMACRHVEQTQREHPEWLKEYRDAGSAMYPYGSRQNVLETMVMLFELRLASAGYYSGLPENAWAVPQLAKWSDLDTARKIQASA